MRKTLAITVALLATLAVTAASAQEPRSLGFERTVDYQLGKLIDLNATVGPVRVEARYN